MTEKQFTLNGTPGDPAEFIAATAGNLDVADLVRVIDSLSVGDWLTYGDGAAVRVVLERVL